MADWVTEDSVSVVYIYRPKLMTDNLKINKNGSKVLQT